ncbi:MAG: phage holin, lambda family [Pseudomonas sp.]|uniref:phage holin, lambda family n=1 Tax=Pseudomonas sp. TaxID=306 RepID=UPI0033977F5B
MPDKPETWAWLSAWLQLNLPALYAGGLAFVISMWRIIYTGGKFRQIVMESPLCGFVGVGVTYGAEFVGASTGVGAFFGSVVGLLGIETMRAVAHRALEKKVDQL